jgi:hypothetical protein
MNSYSTKGGEGMHKTKLCLVSFSALLLALPIGAQEKPGTVAGLFIVKPKAGMRQQYEVAQKRHMGWHREHKDPWAISVWEIASGERSGLYVYGIFGHHWTNFDSHAKVDEADMADFNVSVAQYVESQIASYYNYQPGISCPAPDNARAAIFEVVQYHLNMGGESDFLQAARKVREAIEKSNYPVHYEVYELFNGGEHPAYMLRFPHKNWADLQPPQETFMAMLEKVYGRQEAEAVLKLFSTSVHCVRSEIALSRPDMGYIPAAE